MRKSLLLGLALLPAFACAQESSDWLAYRDAYRHMLWFEKYGKPKQLLQNHLRLRPRDAGVSMDGLRLSLHGKDAQLALPLDALGRAVFPFSKAAYDDNAELMWNRKPGQVMASAWVSIVARPDGVYATADLRAACEQLLAYLRYTGGANDKRCAGVQFAYPRTEAAQVRYQGGDGAALPLAAQEGPAFPGDAVSGFRVFAYRFNAHPQTGQVLTSGTPLAIAALLE
ncbi:hypothetical protein GCN78_00405 [Janthinobacterium rivuli]|uniref:hypothetical protein n=1 Tax=Janthinobacterium sp. FT68W TaxID=2654255 RepID=UPI001264DC7D|nr:hypothetical protein [Janthinobacterium sp. FT68W]KAB8055430.1 hypothetical protein GCN78_00405 [Janthinobacterium sp. FT68W]